MICTLLTSHLSLGSESEFQAGTAKVEITPSAESAVDLLGQPLTATIAIARLLANPVKTDESLAKFREALELEAAR